MYKYKAFGLGVLSEIVLNDLPSENAETDVTIRFGDVPEQLGGDIINQGVRYQLTKNSFLQNINRVARYWVKEGTEIIIKKYDGATNEEIVFFMLTTPIGVLLHQRGHLPLHASAFEINNKAVIITGNSGVGKSTLLTMLTQRGYKMLTEEICAIELINNKPQVAPGPAYSYLWKDAILHLGKDFKTLKGRINNPDKFKIDLSKSYCNKTLPLVSIYVLETKNSPGLIKEELLGFEKFLSLWNNIYRPRIAKAITNPINMLKFNAAIGTQTTVKRITRPKDWSNIDKLCDLILNDFQAQ